MGGSNVITRILTNERGRRESQRRRNNELGETQVLALKREGGHKPRNAGSFQKLEKAQTELLP